MLSQEGEKLLSETRSVEVKVRPRLTELTDSWDTLIHNCKEKRSRLQEAYEVHTHTLNMYPNVSLRASDRRLFSGAAVPAFSG